ncbi:hypothetical protein Fot_15255 [Forsythia ovata]|uniref:Uncharacterized protein n=1 Tax=Forsythia ovata TaxID=205694 RepID=A0ABD1W8X7_9LAMI
MESIRTAQKLPSGLSGAEGPLQKVSTKAKSTQSVVSKAKATKFSVEKMMGKSRTTAGSSRTRVPTNEKEFSSIWFQNKLLYDRLVTNILIKLGTDLKVWTKLGVEVRDGGTAHFMPTSPTDWGTFMTDFWTFQANVMDNLSELRAQNRELMTGQDHLDEMIKNLQDSEDED